MWRALTPILVMNALTNAVQASEIDALERCFITQIQLAQDSYTVAEIKQACESTSNTASEAPETNRISGTISSGNQPRGFRSFFTPYKENYILLGSMQNRDGSDPFSGKTTDIRFEFGMKFRVFQTQDDWARKLPIYVGYSQKAWWDIAESSAPFREHNYNPEMFWDFREGDLADVKNESWLAGRIGAVVDRIGIEHQSNGLAGPESRSWDRIYAQKTYYSDNNQFALRLKAWNVINLGNENSDITDFLGNLEARLSYRPNDKFEINGTVLKGHQTSKYSYRLDLISSLGESSNSKLMLSYYDGFGEALISYNQKTSSLRAGIFIPISFD